METVFLAALCFISYAYFFTSFTRHGEINLSFLSGLFIFISIQYGPHTVFHTDLVGFGINEIVTAKTQTFYASILATIYIVLGALNSLVPKRYFLASSIYTADSTRAQRQSSFITNSFLIYTVMMIIVSIALGGIPILIEHYNYYINDTTFTYSQIRRELFGETTWSTVAAYLRFTLLPLTCGVLVYAAITLKRNRYKRILYAIIAVAAPLICAIQLNKLFYFYYIFVYGFIVHFAIQGKEARLSLKRITTSQIALFVAAATFLYILFNLYAFQYRENLQSGSLDNSQLLQTLAYRILFATSDAVKLWIQYFIVEFEPVHFESIGKLCTLTTNGCINAPAMIPAHYLNTINTSMQPGFLGTGISFFGYPGVLFALVVVFSLAVINNLSLYRASHYLIGAVARPIMFMSSYLICSMELTTAMLTGGALVVPIFVSLHLRRRRRKEREILLAISHFSTSKNEQGF